MEKERIYSRLQMCYDIYVGRLLRKPPLSVKPDNFPKYFM